MNKLISILTIMIVFMVSGCLNNSEEIEQTISTDPQERCVEVCRDQIAAGVDLNIGPCLSETNGVEWNIEDWSCDVVHQPREIIDDTSLHQCQEYRKENTNHFVEVSPNCEFIRKQ
jgi:hypothetical protein